MVRTKLQHIPQAPKPAGLKKGSRPTHRKPRAGFGKYNIAEQDGERIQNILHAVKRRQGLFHDHFLDGRRARPMGAYVRRHENAVYFLTDVRHHKDEEIKQASDVCLAFADTSDNTYVSVSGKAQVYEDRAKVKELWSTPAKAWWETADDPNIRVLRVTPAFAEYWDSSDSVLSYVEMAVAAMT